MEHQLEHRNTDASMALDGHFGVDMTGDAVVTSDGVTPPGAWHPECGSHPEISPEIKIATKHGGPRPGAGRPRKVEWAAVQPVRVLGGRWHCVEFEPGCDLLVINQMHAARFEVFFPTFMPAARPARPGQAAREVVPQAALGRYLFVRFDQSDPSWRAIPGMLGVARLFSLDAERPIVVPDAEVARLVRLFGEDGEAMRPAGPPAPLAIGAAVRVVAGLLAGHVGIGIVEWSDGREVRVRFGGKPVTMAQVAVEVV